MNHSPEQELAIVIAGQGAQERSADDRRLAKLAKWVTAATLAVGTLLSPNIDAVDSRQDSAMQEPHAEFAEPTPGYERGRAEEVTYQQSIDAAIDVLEPTQHGRQRADGESIPSRDELVKQPSGEGRPTPALFGGTRTSRGVLDAELIGKNAPMLDSGAVNAGDPLEGGLPGKTRIH